jgi:apolipoprotein N-acyltransferase
VVASLAVLVALVLSVRRLPDVARVSFNVGMGLWLVSIVWFLADQDRAPRALGHGVLWLVAGLPALAFALQGPRKGALPARSATDA